MKLLIVQAHPEPLSFNAALTARAVETLVPLGHEVQVSDLYAMGWDPVSDRRNFTGVADGEFFRQQREEVHGVANNGFADDIQAEMEKLQWSDGLILQFPLWWFGMPAILKGWIDRVFAMDFAYGRGRWYERGPFAGKRALVSITTGSPSTGYGEDGLHGSLETVLFPINHGMLHFTGFDVLPPFAAYAVNHIELEGRQAALDAYEARLRNFWTDEPLVYPALDEFNSEMRRVGVG